MLVEEKTNYGRYGVSGANALAPEIKREERKKLTRKNKKGKVASTLAGISIVFAIGFIIVMRNASLTQVLNNIDKQNKYLANLDEINSQLKSDMFIDLKTVDETAKGKLGMDRPYSYQVVYLDLGVKNKTEEKTNETESKLAQKISEIVEYIY